MSGYSLQFAFCDRVADSDLRKVLNLYLAVSRKVRAALYTGVELSLDHSAIAGRYHDMMEARKTEGREELTPAECLELSLDTVTLLSAAWWQGEGAGRDVYLHYQTELKELASQMQIKVEFLVGLLFAQLGPLEFLETETGGSIWQNFHILFPVFTQEQAQRILNPPSVQPSILAEQGKFQSEDSLEFFQLALTAPVVKQVLSLSNRYEHVTLTELRSGCWWRGIEGVGLRGVVLSFPQTEMDAVEPAKTLRGLYNYLRLSKAKTQAERDRIFRNAISGR